MKIAVVLASAAVILAGAPSTVQAAAPAPAPHATAAPDKSASTVSGVTVQGLSRKPCAPKDKECIALVMAQVKDLYPEQLKQFCFRENMDVMKQNMQANIAGWCDGPGLGASELCHRHLSPVVKQVCAPDKSGTHAADKGEVRK